MRRLVICFAAALATAGPATAAAPQVSTTVDPQTPTTRVASHFLGISREIGYLGTELGAPKAPNQFLIGVLRTLATHGQGGPVFRLGGGSADSSWWNPDLRKRPSGIILNLTPPLADVMGSFARAAGTPLILTLNLAAADPSYGVGWAAAVRKVAGPKLIMAYEIGNEPDIYPKRSFGPRTARGKDYSLARYGRELVAYRRALARSIPNPTIAGPDICCHWDAQLKAFAKRYRSVVDLVTIHEYPLSACDHTLTVKNMLAEKTLRIALNRLKALQQYAAAGGLPIRITETSSGACGGKAGVTDTQAQAVWTADWLFMAAAVKYRGVNFHVSGGYSPWYDTLDNGLYHGRVQPMYYAMLLFARAVADHARILPWATLQAKLRGHARARVWATRTTRELRAVVVNREAHRAVTAVLRFRDAAATGTVQLQRAPGLLATTGATLAGQKVPDQSTEGRLVGALVTPKVRARHGRFRVRVPAASVLMLTVPRR